MIVKPGTTDLSIVILVVDDDGVVVNDLEADAFPKSGTLPYTTVTASNDIPLHDLSTLADAHSDGGVFGIGGGRYRVDLPDSLLASAGKVEIFGEDADLHIIAEPIQVADIPCDVALWKGATAPAMTGDAYARIGSPAGASLVADLGTATEATQTIVLAVKAKTDSLAFTGTDVKATLDSETVALTAGHGLAVDSTVAKDATVAKAATVATASALATTDGKVDSIKAKTDNLPASPAAVSNIPTAAQVRSEIDSNSTQLAAIKTQTDKLADASIGLANLKALIDAVDDYVDTEVAAIKTQTDKIGDATIGLANLKALIDVIDGLADAIKAKTDQLTFTGGTVDANAEATLDPKVASDIADIKTQTDQLVFADGKVDANAEAAPAELDPQVMEDIAAMKAKIDNIGLGSITYQSSVDAAGTMRIYAGQDYDGSMAIIITRTSWAGPSLTGSTGKLLLQTFDNYKRATRVADLDFAAVITQTGDTVTATIELTDTESGTIWPTTSAAKPEYWYQVVATAGDQTVLVAEGKATSKKVMTEAV